MSREKLDPEVVKAVEEAAVHRILGLTDKQLMQKFPQLSRSAIYRIMRKAKAKFDMATIEMKQTSQVSKSQ
jgi:uncharacterized protein YktA (UPF0223 family)